MTPLQRLHYKIVELGSRSPEIPFESILNAFQNDPHVIDHLELLADIQYIEVNRGKGTIKLTTNGKLANVPGSSKLNTTDVEKRPRRTRRLRYQ